MAKLTARWMHDSIVSRYEDKREGGLALYRFVKEGLAKGDLKASDIEIADIAIATGALDPMDVEGSVARVNRYGRDTENVFDAEQRIQESAAASVTTSTFQVITGEVLSAQVRDGYNTDGGYIGGELCTVERTSFRNQRMASLKGMGGLLEVPENHPYEETGLGERWVQTSEKKYGRVLSISMETLMFDRSGSIRRAMNLFGVRAREKKEEIIVNGVIDKDSNVYRPSGIPTQLYATGNYNLIGTAGAPTGWTNPIALADWEDIDTVLHFRATQVTDDRVDGTPQPIQGLNKAGNVLLVPWALHLQAHYALGWDNQIRGTAGSPGQFEYKTNPASPFVGRVLQSPYLDTVSATTWFYGDFKSQFVYTEILPEAVFTQDATSDAAFDRDTNLRVKIRFFGGISSIDTPWVTKILGA